jgi:hypothetical protein
MRSAEVSHSHRANSLSADVDNKSCWMRDSVFVTLALNISDRSFVGICSRLHPTIQC